MSSGDELGGVVSERGIKSSMVLEILATSVVSGQVKRRRAILTSLAHVRTITEEGTRRGNVDTGAFQKLRTTNFLPLLNCIIPNLRCSCLRPPREVFLPSLHSCGARLREAWYAHAVHRRDKAITRHISLNL